MKFRSGCRFAFRSMKFRFAFRSGFRSAAGPARPGQARLGQARPDPARPARPAPGSCNPPRAQDGSVGLAPPAFPAQAGTAATDPASPDPASLAQSNTAWARREPRTARPAQSGRLWPALRSRPVPARPPSHAALLVPTLSRHDGSAGRPARHDPPRPDLAGPGSPPLVKEHQRKFGFPI